MEENDVETNDWRHTRKAVKDFRQLLLCAKCSNFLKEPVCLGLCGHMLCRSCSGSRAGAGCVVCGSPAWVKDLQINRQLSGIIQVFSGLESLLNPLQRPASPEPEAPASPEPEAPASPEPEAPASPEPEAPASPEPEVPASPEPEAPAPPEATLLKHKKKFKIWFSPRSRKVRCKVDKPPVDPKTSKGTSRPECSRSQAASLDVFNFTPQSQDSDSPSPDHTGPKKKRKKKGASKKIGPRAKKSFQGAQRKTRAARRKLEDINKQWDVGEEAHVEATGAEEGKKSRKKVCFVSPVEADDPQEALDPPGLDTSPPPEQTQVAEKPTESPVRRRSPSPEYHAEGAEPMEAPATPQDVTKPSRANDKAVVVETTPRSSRTSPVPRRVSRGHLFPSVLKFLSASSPGSGRRCRGEQREGCSDSASPSSWSARLSSGSPLIARKNYKGETLLHLAAIKGDVEAVTELLDQGADPNLKDNAGWTPLHEACNLGHLAVVEALVTRGALLNTPGYENDSPLHDAVRNGHKDVVKVLLRLGASPSVLNLHGKHAVDYAATPEMLEIFNEASRDVGDPDHSTLNTSASSLLASSCLKTDEVVLLSSKLSQAEQQQLGELGRLLEGRIADTFSGSVSHVVVPQGSVPTTTSALLGLLSGCWVVKFSWVQASLQKKKLEPEKEHEAGEGAQRSRINKCNLLPRLFDGCFFFLLGSFSSPSRAELTRLLVAGGGRTLSRRPKPDSDVTQTLSAAAYHALQGSDQELCTQYIVYDPRGQHRPTQLRRGKVWTTPSSWIIDCITSFCLLPVPEYTPEHT